MCGITGFVNANGEPIDGSVLERMNHAIIHRGPDEDGFYVHENVGLAVRRLSIIDVASGQQPIHNADRSKWIVFNGEIYNYQSLREGLLERDHKLYTKSDTEAVVCLYDEFGPDCLQYLRGMFAFAIWDERDNSLFIARDRVGKKPLLYSHQPNGDLIFGSEFQALLQHPSVSREVDHEAIDSYLSYLCVPAPQTAFKQIRKLEPGPLASVEGRRDRNAAILAARFFQKDKDHRERSDRRNDAHSARIDAAEDDIRGSLGCVSFRRCRFVGGRRLDGPGKLDSRSRRFRSALRKRISASSNTQNVSPNTSVPNITNLSSGRTRSMFCRPWSSITASRMPIRRRSRPITSQRRRDST